MFVKKNFWLKNQNFGQSKLKFASISNLYTFLYLKYSPISYEIISVNHLAHYLLIRELEELLKGGRVVFTTSSLYKNGDTSLPLLSKDPSCPDDYITSKGVTAYAQSKMAMNMCALGLTSQLPYTDFILTSPGMVRNGKSTFFFNCRRNDAVFWKGANFCTKFDLLNDFSVRGSSYYLKA